MNGWFGWMTMMMSKSKQQVYCEKRTKTTTPTQKTNIFPNKLTRIKKIGKQQE